jgi:hypothetical protein
MDIDSVILSLDYDSIMEEFVNKDLIFFWKEF